MGFSLDKTNRSFPDLSFRAIHQLFDAFNAVGLPRELVTDKGTYRPTVVTNASGLNGFESGAPATARSDTVTGRVGEGGWLGLDHGKLALRKFHGICARRLVDDLLCCQIIAIQDPLNPNFLLFQMKRGGGNLQPALMDFLHTAFGGVVFAFDGDLEANTVVRRCFCRRGNHGRRQSTQECNVCVFGCMRLLRNVFSWFGWNDEVMIVMVTTGMVWSWFNSVLRPNSRYYPDKID